MTYIMVDVEADGPIPGDYLMSSGDGQPMTRGPRPAPDARDDVTPSDPRVT
jgi:hypothetical protein